MTAELNKRIMERHTSEFLPTGDAALAEEFISPDIVMHFAGQQQQGRDTYLGIVAANSVAFPDLRWTVEDMVAEGDTVAVRYTMTGTHQGTFAGVAATGTAVRAESMTFYRLADGKIVEERAQLDMLSLLQQMGAVPRGLERVSDPRSGAEGLTAGGGYGQIGSVRVSASPRGPQRRQEYPCPLIRSSARFSTGSPRPG